jgi:hypothetical protein
MQRLAAEQVARRPLLGNDGDDFGNHVTGPAHDHRIADPDILAPTSSSLCSVALVTVTPPTKTGFSRATGVIAPVRPTWTSMPSTSVSASSAGNLWAMAKRGARETKPSRSCQREAVDLVHHAVDVVGQARARFSPIFGKKIEQTLAPRHTARARGTGKPQAASLSISSPCVLTAQPSPRPDAVGEEGQRPAGGDPRIELAQAAGRGIARVDELLVAALALAGVQFGENLP